MKTFVKIHKSFINNNMINKIIYKLNKKFIEDNKNNMNNLELSQNEEIKQSDFIKLMSDNFNQSIQLKIDDHLNHLELILNNIILNQKCNIKKLNKYETKYYIYILGLIVDERNRLDKKHCFSVLDELEILLKDFDVQCFFSNKRKIYSNCISSNNPGPIDLLIID
jgi:hypothetical protein